MKIGFSKSHRDLSARPSALSSGVAFFSIAADDSPSPTHMSTVGFAALPREVRFGGARRFTRAISAAATRRPRSG
jgi:hypothetical protein